MLVFQKMPKQIIHCHRQGVPQLSGSGIPIMVQQQQMQQTAWLQGTFSVGNILFHGRYNKQKQREDVLVNIQPL